MRSIVCCWLGVVAILAVVGPAKAEVAWATIAVDGLSCPFCVAGLEKRLKAVDGVTAVKTSLKDGTARLSFTDETVPSPTVIRTAVKKAGFTARTVRFTAVGRVVVVGERKWLAVRGWDGALLLVGAGDEAATQVSGLADSGRVAVATGPVEEQTDAPLRLTIERIEPLHVTTLQVSGMKCERCPERVDAALEEMAGVYRAEVDTEAARVVVESIGREVAPDRLIAALAKAGFAATAAGDGGADA